jgi:predicted dehydrogenase
VLRQKALEEGELKTVIRLGVVGYGMRGKAMFRLGCLFFEGVEPAAICESSPERLRQAKEDWPKVQHFEDYNEMLETADVDALLVETPAINHALFCDKALENNICVMSDVPCVFSYEEAEMLWKTQQQSTGIFMIGANPNMWGFVEAAADINKKGLLGKPYFLEAEYIHDCRALFKASPWRETLEPIRYCTHSLGPLLRLIDEDIRWVSCFDTGSHINSRQGQHDAMTAIFRTGNNVVLRFTCSFINNFKGGLHYYRVLGTKGCFERTSGRGKIEQPRVLMNSEELYCAKAITELPVDEVRQEYRNNPRPIAEHGDADWVLFEEFFTAIRNNLPSPISLREGLRMSLPGVFAAISAQNRGQLTRIQYPWD